MRAAHVLLAPLLVLAQPVSLCAQNIKLSSSLPDLEAAARKDSNDAQALYNVALGYWSKKRYDDGNAPSALRSPLSRASRQDGSRWESCRTGGAPSCASRCPRAGFPTSGSPRSK